MRVEVFSAKRLEQVKIYILWRPYFTKLVMGAVRPPPIDRSRVEVVAEYCTWEKLLFACFALVSNNPKERFDLKDVCSN